MQAVLYVCDNSMLPLFLQLQYFTSLHLITYLWIVLVYLLQKYVRKSQYFNISAFYLNYIM